MTAAEATESIPLAGEFDDAVENIASLLPDVLAALDRLVPVLASDATPDRIRRYVGFVDLLIDAIATELAVGDPVGAAPDTVAMLLRRATPSITVQAPTPTGHGILTALVDRARGYAFGYPCVFMRPAERFSASDLTSLIDQIATARQTNAPASFVAEFMRILDLNTTDVGRLMGVRRQAVDKWLALGPPADRLPKLGAIASIASILDHRLRDGMPAVVARRSASAYGDRTMLELIEADEHDRLLDSVRASFDYANVA